MPELNTQLLQEVVDYIETHPEEWDQDSWANKGTCGTTLCFAGTTALLDPQVEFIWMNRGEYSVAIDIVKDDGDWDEIEEYAQRRLGLTNREAYTLFHYTRTDLEQLKLTIKNIVNGKYR